MKNYLIAYGETVATGFEWTGDAEHLFASLDRIGEKLREHGVLVVRTGQVIEKMSDESGKSVRELEIKFEGLASHGRQLSGVLTGTETAAGRFDLSLSKIVKTSREVDASLVSNIGQLQQMRARFFKAFEDINEFRTRMATLATNNQSVQDTADYSNRSLAQQQLIDRLRLESEQRIADARGQSEVNTFIAQRQQIANDNELARREQVRQQQQVQFDRLSEASEQRRADARARAEVNTLIAQRQQIANDNELARREQVRQQQQVQFDQLRAAADQRRIDARARAEAELFIQETTHANELERRERVRREQQAQLDLISARHTRLNQLEADKSAEYLMQRQTTGRRLTPQQLLEANRIQSAMAAAFNDIISRGPGGPGGLPGGPGSIADLYTSTLRAMQSGTMQTLNAAQQQMAAFINQMNHLTGVANNQNASVRSLNLSWVNFAKFFTIHIAYTAFFQTMQALKKGLDDAVELQKRLAEINSISQDKPLTGGFNGLLQMSNTSGFDAKDVSKTAYEAISNQIANGQSVKALMSDITDFARVTNSTLEQSGDNLANVLNAYGRGIGGAEDAYAKLFKIIELGRIRGEEISNTFGRVLAPAAQLGVGLDEVGALMEVLSIRGIKASESITQVNAIINSALSPTEKWASRLKSLGYATAEEAIQVMGLTGYLKLMIQQVKASEITIGEVFSNVRARRPLQTLFQDNNMDLFIENLEKTQKAVESFRRAKEIVLNTDVVKFEQSSQRIHNLWVGIGDKLIFFRNLTVGKLFDSYDIATKGDTQTGFQNKIAAIFKDKNLSDQKLFDEITAKLKARSAQYVASLTQVRTRNLNLMEDMSQAGKRMADSLQVSFETVFNSILRQINLLESNLKRLEGLKNKAQSAKIDSALARKNPIEQVQYLKNQFADLRKEGFELFKKGNLDEGIKKFEDAQVVMEKMFALRDKLVSERKTNIEGNEGGKLTSVIKQQEEALRQLDYNEFYNVVYNAQHVQLQKTSDLVNLQNEFIDEQIKANQRRVDLIANAPGASIEKARQNLQIQQDNTKNFLRDFKDYKLVDEAGQPKDMSKIQSEMNTLVGSARALNLPLDMMQQIYVLQNNILSRAQIAESNKALNVLGIGERQNADLTGLTKKYDDMLAKRKEFQERLLNLSKAIPQTKGLQVGQIFPNLGIVSSMDSYLSTLTKQVTTEKDNVVLERYLLLIGQLKNTFLEKNQTGTLTGLYGAKADETLNALTFLQDYIQQYRELKTAQYEYLKDQQRLGMEPTSNALSSVFSQLDPNTQDFVSKPGSLYAQAESMMQSFPTILDWLLQSGSDFNVSLLAANTSLDATVIKTEKVRDNLKEAALFLLDATILRPALDIPRMDYSKLFDATKSNLYEKVGFKGFASGGRAGIDSIPAMLSPGEFVMNPSSTNRFYRQLVHMNAGFQPRGFAAGGATSIGDINVSVNEAQSPAQTARALGTEIRRELRRGSLTFKR